MEGLLVRTVRNLSESENNGGFAQLAILQEQGRLTTTEGVSRVQTWSLNRILPRYDVLTANIVNEPVNRELLRQVLYLAKEDPSFLDHDTHAALKHMYQCIEHCNTVCVLLARRPTGRFYASNDLSIAYPGCLRAGTIADLPRKIKGTMFRKGGYVDIDQAKSGMSILLGYGKLCRIPCAALEDYIENPGLVHDQTETHFWSNYNVRVPKDQIKNLYQRLSYLGGFGSWRDEVKDLPNHATEPPVYGAIRSATRKITDEILLAHTDLIARYAQEGCSDIHSKTKTVSTVLHTIENHLSCKMLKAFMDAKIIRDNRFIWSWDGFSFVPARPYEECLATANEEIRQLQGFDHFRFVTKEPDPEHIVDILLDNDHPKWRTVSFRDFDLKAKPLDFMREIAIKKDYIERKGWWEKMFFFDLQTVMYYRITTDAIGRITNTEPLSTLQMKALSKNVFYTDQEPKKKRKNDENQEEEMEEVQKSFFDQWEKDPRRRTYQGVINCPPGYINEGESLCFNAWANSPYHDIPRKAGTAVNQEAIDEFLFLLRVNCDNNDELFAYMKFWIAHMIQLPHKKIGVIPVIAGSEGTGKSLFLTYLRWLMGMSRSVEMTRAENLTGQFNSLLEGKYLVILNECPFGELAMDVLKAIATEYHIAINRKGCAQKEVLSFHRFIFTTNNPQVLQGTDRRALYLRSGLELKMDPVRFGRFWTRIQDNARDAATEDFFQTVYRYFQEYNIEDLDEEQRKPPRLDEVNMDIMNTDPKRAFLIRLCDKYQHLDEIRLTSAQIKAERDEWIDQEALSFPLLEAHTILASLQTLSVGGMLIRPDKETTDRVFKLNLLRERMIFL